MLNPTELVWEMYVLDCGDVGRLNCTVAEAEGGEKPVVEGTKAFSGTGIGSNGKKKS